MRALVVFAAFLGLLVPSDAGAAPEPVEVAVLVVDEQLRPRAGAQIEVHLGDAAGRAETDDQGRAVVALPAPPDEHGAALRIQVRDSAGERPLGAWQRVSLAAARATARTRLVVRPIETVTLTLRSAAGAPQADVAVDLCTGSRFGRTRWASARSDGAGHVRFEVPPGGYTLSVADERFAGKGHGFAVPGKSASGGDGAADRTVTVEPARVLTVRVVDDASGAPVAGALVQAADGWRPLFPFAPRVETDAAGVARLERMPSGRVPVAVRTARPGTRGAGHAEAGADEVVIRLARGPSHTVRWPVEPDPARPPDGAPLTFLAEHRQEQIERPARLEDGHVVLEDWHDPSDYGHAVFEERVAAWLRYDLVPRRPIGAFDDLDDLEWRHVSLPTAFRATSSVTVEVRHADGTPAVDRRVRLSGRYLLRDATGRLRRTHAWRDRTGPDGRITWEGAFFEPTRVEVVEDGARIRVLGTVDPAPGEIVEAVYTLPAERYVDLRITFDGVATLHAGIQVHCAGTVGDVEADPERATLRFPFRHAPDGESVWLSVSLDGYESFSAHIDPAERGPWTFDVPLRSVMHISVVLDPEPEGYVPGESIQLHRLDEETGDWVLEGDCDVHGAHSFMLIDEIKEQGHPCWRRIGDCVAGSYRLVHVPSGIAGEPFAIDRSRPVWVARFTVPAMRTVEGRFVADPPISFADARIEDRAGVPGYALSYLGPDASEIRDRGRVRPDGRFSVEVAADRPARLRLVSPLVRRGDFDIPVKSPDPLEVPVGVHPVLTVCFDAPPDKEAKEALIARWAPSRGWHRHTNRYEYAARQRHLGETEAPHVHLRREDAEGRVTWARCERVLHEETLHVPLADPGTYTLVLDLVWGAPVLLEDVAVGERGTTLTRSLPRGSRVRIQVLDSERSPASEATATLTPVTTDGPPFRRFARTDAPRGPDPRRLPAEARLVLLGVPAGTYDIRVACDRQHGARDGAPEHVDLRVTVDGETDQELIADFRPLSERDDDGD